MRPNRIRAPPSCRGHSDLLGGVPPVPGGPVGVAAPDDPPDDPPDDAEVPADGEEVPDAELDGPPADPEELAGVPAGVEEPVSDADAGWVLVSEGAGEEPPDPPLTDTDVVAVACWKFGSPL
jgi:hypothetical protein